MPPKRIFITADHGMAIPAGLKPLTQYMEALRADWASRVYPTSTN